MKTSRRNVLAFMAAAPAIPVAAKLAAILPQETALLIVNGGTSATPVAALREFIIKRDESGRVIGLHPKMGGRIIVS